MDLDKSKDRGSADQRNIDERYTGLHRYLDGDMTSSEAAAFEESLQGDVALRNRVAALQDMEKWFKTTRPQAPSLGATNNVDVPPRTLPLPAAPSLVKPRGGWSRQPGSVLALGGVLLAAATLFIAVRMDALRPETRRPQNSHQVAENRGITEDRGAAAASNQPISPANTVLYEFEFRSRNAREVCLAGDFNHWKVCGTRLERVGEDLWKVSMELPKGRHEYMFVVDGHWVSDPGAASHVDDGFGNKNAVLTL